ncbi:MAG: glycosyltransferase family 39 protein [Patescibacteria group bacterium]
MKLLKNEKFILILIIFLAIFLRIIALPQIPLGFYRDEILNSYEAYSILTTGKDQWGNFLPLRFKGFGDWPPPLYFYFNVPFVLIFGLNEWVIRLPAALLGILTVWLTFLLVKELFKNKNIAFLSSLLMAISPWHLHYSRLNFPAIMIPFLITLGLWLFFYGLNHKKEWPIYFAVFFISLTIWSYSIAQVFTPLLLLGLLIFYRKELKKKIIFGGILTASILFLPFIFLTLKNYSFWQVRFDNISIFNTKKPFLSFINNYFSHLSPKFLFFRGDINLRHHVFGMGQLYLFEAIAFIYLIIYLIKKKTILPHLNFLIYWFLIFPFASSLTIENIPHATRTIVGLPLLHILSALGLYFLFSFFKKELVKVIFYSFLILIIGICFFWFIINYFFLYPKYSAPAFFYGQKEVVNYIRENYNYYDKIIISGKNHHPYLYLLFYLPYLPEKFHHSQIETEQFSLDTIVVNSFDKFIFEYDFKKIEKFLPKTLYVEYYFSKGKISHLNNLKIKKIIYFPNGLIAYRIMALE